jgi:hypothetical protein
MGVYLLVLMMAGELGLIAAQGSAGFVARVAPSLCVTVQSRVQTLSPIGASGSDAQVELLDIKINRTPLQTSESSDLCFITFPGDDALAQDVKSMAGVAYVERSQEFSTTHHIYDPARPAPWGLDRIDQGNSDI